MGNGATAPALPWGVPPALAPDVVWDGGIAGSLVVQAFALACLFNSLMSCLYFGVWMNPVATFGVTTGESVHRMFVVAARAQSALLTTTQRTTTATSRPSLLFTIYLYSPVLCTFAAAYRETVDELSAASGAAAAAAAVAQHARAASTDATKVSLFYVYRYTQCTRILLII